MGAAAILMLLLIPMPYLACPAWKVVVQDEAGHPLSGMLVRLDFENYSAEDTFHEVDLYTDTNGQVTFPPKRGFTSLLRRCWFTTLSAMAFAHASFGPTAYVLVFGGGREGAVNSGDGSVYFWDGHPNRVTSVVVARPKG